MNAPFKNTVDANQVRRGFMRQIVDIVETVHNKLTRRPKKDAWDKQIEEDAAAGKLDNLMEEAREEHRKGETKPLP